MTRIFQAGLFIESLLNIFGAVVFILYPAQCLSNVVSTPTVAPSATVLFQVYGGLVLALTVPLLLCIPNKPGAFEKRNITFTTLASGEVVLIAILLYRAFSPVGSGFKWSGLVLSAIFLLPALMWHLWPLWVRPDLMGERSVENKRKNL